MATCSNITSSTDTTIDARIEEWIDRITGAVIGSYGFVEADHDDLKQDLRLWLLEMRASFNPARSCSSSRHDCSTSSVNARPSSAAGAR